MTHIARYRHADGREMAVTDGGEIMRRRAGGKRFTRMSQIIGDNRVEKAKTHAAAIAAAHGYRKVA